MCTVIVLRRPHHPWPLLIAANRDEMNNRPWQPPARHWDDRPNVVAGLDELAQGSWMGLNDEGVTAAILNRVGTLGPQAGKRSRGELVLDALDYSDAIDAADALRHLDARAYRPFNMIIADNRDAFWVRADGVKVRAAPLPEGLSMLTAYELNDTADPRIRAFLPRFQTVSPPDPDKNEWSGWSKLLATGASDDASHPEAGLSFQLASGFGTRSSALLALPSIDRLGTKPVWLFAPGPLASTQFVPVPL